MHQDPSFEKFLCNCMIPPKESQNLIKESSTEESLQVSAAASVHEGKKPFKCDSCDDSFHLKDTLQQHVATVHDRKMPFKCDSCDYGCLSNDDMTQHVASVHEESSGSTSSKSKPKTNKICKSTVPCRLNRLFGIFLYKIAIFMRLKSGLNELKNPPFSPQLLV